MILLIFLKEQSATFELTCEFILKKVWIILSLIRNILILIFLDVCIQYIHALCPTMSIGNVW